MVKGGLLERISNAIQGIPNLDFQGERELRANLIKDNAFFHSIGNVNDPNIAEKIGLVKEHGLLCFDEIKKVASPELLDKTQEHRDNDRLRGININCNHTDKVSVFNYNSYLSEVRNSRERPIFNHDDGSLYYKNYSAQDKISFKIDQQGLDVSGDGAAPGEKLVTGKIPPENILGVVIPDCEDLRTPEEVEDLRKTIVQLFTDAKWAVNFYSGKTGELVASNKKSVEKLENKDIEQQL